MNLVTDILIVGAGVTGLRLAGILNKDKCDYLVVEARDRIGGRVLSSALSTLADGVYDMGPAWFWPGQPRVADLAAKLGLTVFDQYAKGRMVFEDPSGAIRRDLEMAPMAGSLRIAGGLGALTGGLATALPADRVHLNTVVTGLTQTDDGILAASAASDGPAAVRANKVVLAIPPRLAAERVAFDPVLPPEAHEAMRAVPTWMAGHAKVVAVYERPFWREAGLSGDAISRRGPLAEIHDASPHAAGEGALFGFVGVPAGARRAAGRDLTDAAIRQLTALFGPQASQPLAVHIQDWAAERFTATKADEMPPAGHPTYGLPAPMQDLWGGHLVLASAETGQQHGGFIEGALEAAEAAAHALLTGMVDPV
ncbi:MAG: FAD-dependent oxidoreductase [Pseudomonadota bacterium]